MSADNAVELLVVLLLACSLAAAFYGIAVGAAAIRRSRREQREQEAADAAWRAQTRARRGAGDE